MPRTEVELPGGFKLKGGAITVVVIVLVVLAFWWFQPDQQKEVLNQKELNAALQEQYRETAKHIGEELKNATTLFESLQGKIVVGIYRDRCIAHIAMDAEGTIIATGLTRDILKDGDRRADLGGLIAALHASTAVVDSRCNYVNHGNLARPPQEEQRQGNNVLMHVWMQDGCEFRQWWDQLHNTYGPRMWIVCRH